MIFIEDLKEFLSKEEFKIIKCTTDDSNEKIINYQSFDNYKLILVNNELFIFGFIDRKNLSDLNEFLRSNSINKNIETYSNQNNIEILDRSQILNNITFYQKYILYNDISELQEKVTNVIAGFEKKNPWLKVILNVGNGELPKGFYMKDEVRFEVNNWNDFYHKDNNKIKAVFIDSKNFRFLFKIEKTNDNKILLLDFNDGIISQRKIDTYSSIKTHGDENQGKGFGSLITAFVYEELFATDHNIHYYCDLYNIASIKIAEKFSTPMDLICKEINLEKLKEVVNEMKSNNFIFENAGKGLNR